MRKFNSLFSMGSIFLLILLTSTLKAQQSSIFGDIGKEPSGGLTESGPILWNQMEEPGTGFILCQEFTNPESETETSIAADNFIVPEGETWVIGSIAFVGTFFDYGIGPIDTFNVIFYNDAPGLPGNELVEFYDLTGFTAEEELINGYTVVTYRMKLPTNVTVDEGLYWMSVQAKGNYLETGSWGWNDYWTGSQPSQEQQWHWKNPLNGLGTGYIDWTPAVTVAAVFLSYDLTFALYEPAFDNDLAAIEILSPLSGENLTASEEVTVTIKNEGNFPQSGFDLKYVFDGVEVIENIGSVSINPNEYYDFTFSQTVDMANAGPYDLEVSVMLTGDEYTENDVLTTTVYNYGTLYVLENGVTNATVTTCSGTSVDPGGLNAPFNQNDYGTVTFYPETPGTQVRLTFIEFDIQWAEMELYDGEDISAPSFGIFNNGTGSPGVITAFNETGALTMRFEGSGWDSGPGWVAFISCYEPVEDDFAVLDISLSQNTIVGGEFITAYATIQNYGSLTQSKDVTFTANGEEFGTVSTGDLDPWETTVVEAIWNPMDPGLYTIMASVPEDEGIDDNNSLSLEQEVLEASFLIEGFENETFPPEGWSLTTGAWERSTNWPMFGLGMATAFTTPSAADTLITPMLQIEAGDDIDFYAKGSWWWPGDLEIIFKESGSNTWISLEYYSGFSIPAAPAQFIVDLNDYAGQDGQIGFVAHGNVTWWDIGEVYLDEIYGPKKKIFTENLKAVELSGLTSPNANESTVFDFVVKNTGTEMLDAGSYSLKLLDSEGGELVTMDGLEILPLQSISYAMEYTFMETGPIFVQGYVEFSGDELPEDNLSNELPVYVQQEGTQQTQIGSGTLETWNFPLGTYGAYQLDEMLYKNDEIGLSGIMNGISFYYRNEEALPIEGYPVDIYVGETLEDELPTGNEWITANDLELVFSGTLEMFPGEHMMYIPFDNPYVYGGDNLVVMTYKTTTDYFGEVFWYCHSTTEMQTKWTNEWDFVPDPYDPTNLYSNDEYIRPNARVYVLPTIGEYCDPQTIDGTNNGFYIDGVTLNTIANTGTGSVGGPDYNDYTTMSTNLQRSKYYELSVDVHTDGNGGSVAAWIDYNNDSDFDDEGEKICQMTGQGASFTLNVPIVVADETELGIKRLRIRAGDFIDAINSCETISNGEGEDYLVNITQTQQVYNPATDFNVELNGADVSLNWGVPENPGMAHLESFEMSVWPPEGWEVKTSISLTDPLMDPVDVSWSQTNDMMYVYNGNAAAVCPPEAPDFNWLISPEFGVYGDDAVQFGIHYTSDDAGYSKFYALIEVDGEWETVVEYTDETTWSNHYDEMISVPMDDYAGKMVRLAFVAQHNAAHPIAIDDAIVSSISNFTESYEGLMGYELYRNGELIAEMEDPSVTEYTDVLASTENYSYCIEAVYENSNSEPMCDEVFYLAPLTPPVNLVGTVDELDVHLQWTAPNSGIMRFSDDFEAYTAGQHLAEQNPDDWSTWNNDPGSPEDPFVVDEMAYSGENSVLIENMADLLWLNDELLTDGHYSYNFKLYIPEGYNGYFNVLQEYVVNVGAQWGFQAFFDQNGNGYIDADGQGSASFIYEYDVWMYVELDINLDADWAVFMIDGDVIHEWPWSAGIFGGNDLNQLKASDFYAWNTNGLPKFYIDDVNLMEVFESEDLLNYNIYRNEEVIGNVAETAYSDLELTPGDYNYYVTALYDEGESDPSNILNITVEQPSYLPLFEDFEAYISGEQVACQNSTTWVTWSYLPCDDVEDPYISDEQAHSGTNSAMIVDNNDLVLPFQEYYTTGTYKVSFWMYIPTGKDAYWNVLQDFAGTNSTWGLEVYFDGGNGSLNIDDVTFDYEFDSWMLMELFVDLDEDGAQLLIDGEHIHFWTWSEAGMNQFAALNFFGYSQSSGSCQYYFDDLMIEESEWTMPVLSAPSNLEAEVLGADVHLTWEAPAGDLVQLIQHDNTPVNGYYQSFDWGYGVVFDLTEYPGTTLEMLDFRHSSWGLTGYWEYQVHIVDWDTYTVLEVVGPIPTTVNDDWELEVDLGSVAGSGGLVGVFIEPLGNDPADAYPVVDFDGLLDGSSVYGDLSDLSGFTPPDGDFLMNLWISASDKKELVKAKKFKVSTGLNTATRIPATPFEGDEVTVTQMSKSVSELMGYNVYRDDEMIGNTTEQMYDDLGLSIGQYEYYVTAVYDLGESEPSNVVLADVIVGIETPETGKVSIYPNPVSDELNVKMNASVQYIELLNTNGQVLEQRDVNGEQIERLHLDHLNAGIYYLRIQTSTGWTMEKIVKK